MLSTRRRQDLLALVVFLLLAGWMARDGLDPDRVFVCRDALQNSLPWSAVLERHEPFNRFVGDEVRIYYPYLLQAARVYAGEASPLWTSRGGGGQPFLGNITSSLLHPLTLLAAFLPVTLVPLLQALAVLTLSAFFTWLFLRRRGASAPAAALGAVAFGFGGHQVLWLQYALSHTLLALPLAFWATERLVERRSLPRVAVLAVAFTLFVLGGHPETGWVAALVAGTWAFGRLGDPHGRWLVVGAGLLALALSAVQWLPFLEYARLSHGLWLRQLESGNVVGGVSLGAGVICAVIFLAALALLRAAAGKGTSRVLVAVAAGTVAIVLARRMGMAISGATQVLPEMYGSPAPVDVLLRPWMHGPTPADWAMRAFAGAQDFPGQNAGYAGVLPVLLLVLGAIVGLGGRLVRFCALGSVLLWGAAHAMPSVEALVRLVPGLGEVAPTRLLGPVGFLVAAGGARVLDELWGRAARPEALRAVGRVAVTGCLVLGVSFAALRVPVDPHGGQPIVTRSPSGDVLLNPDHRLVHDGRRAITIGFRTVADADDVRVSVDGRTLRSGPLAATPPGDPFCMFFLAQRTEEGRHRLRIEVRRGERVELLADQPLAIGRARRLSGRDLLAGGLSLALLGWLVMRPRRRGRWLAALLVAADVLSLGAVYNVGAPADELYPETSTTRFLQEQEGPFRIFTEGTILPPDTQMAVGVDHLLSYDNLGYHRTYQWLVTVPIAMDAFASFSFDRRSVAYDSPRFDALDVRYVLTEPGVDLSDIEGFRKVHEGEAWIWENTRNLGRVFVVGRALDVLDDDPDTLLAADPAEVALLEEPWVAPLGGHGTARVIEHHGAAIRVSAEADGPALLVLAENRAPGWEAAVDGGAWEPTLHADVAWQAVPFPAGEHEIRFRYRPPGYRWGLTISLVAAVLWLTLLVRRRRGARRRPVPRTTAR